MSFVLRVARAYMPKWAKKKQMAILFQVTADALGCPEPETAHMGYEDMLQAYADFTACGIDQLREEGEDMEAVAKRLNEAASTLGGTLRRRLRLTDADAYPLIVLLYKNLGIDISGSLPGELTVSHCFFSETYTPSTCELMSAFDSGIMNGIYGSGHLRFSDRITEGSCCCQAVFAAGEGA